MEHQRIIQINIPHERAETRTTRIELTDGTGVLHAFHLSDNDLAFIVPRLAQRLADRVQSQPREG